MPEGREPAAGSAPPPAGDPPLHLSPRAVPWQHAFAWFETGMQLVKPKPAAWAALALLTLATSFSLQAVPGFGPVLGNMVSPLVACGMLYAAAAADRGGRLSLLYAVAAFRAPLPAVAAVVATGVLTFAAEAFAGWWIADFNLLAPESSTGSLSAAAITGIYAIGILASLPLTFVPFHVLFERVAPGAAFAASWNGFAINTLPLLVYAAISLVLLGFGLLTLGIGLVLVLPLWAASSYAAWKEVFAVGEPPADAW